MNIHIFLADDHAIVREGLRLIMESQKDLRVVGESSDGLQTVDQVSILKPDVVVLDIEMPGISGIEAARRIHLARPSTRIVILSIYCSAEHIYRALKSGAMGYVLKESSGKEIIDAVRTVWYSRKRYLSRKISETMIEDYILQREKTQRTDPLECLSLREKEVLYGVVEGKPSKEIARLLHISPKSVDTYRSRLMKKLHAPDLPALIKFAIKHKITSPE